MKNRIIIIKIKLLFIKKHLLSQRIIHGRRVIDPSYYYYYNYVHQTTVMQILTIYSHKYQFARSKGSYLKLQPHMPSNLPTLTFRAQHIVRFKK